MTDTTKPKKPRGFAAMTPERRAEIAAMGGRSVPSDRRSFSQDRALARQAGIKGGETSRRPSAEGDR